VIAAEKEKAYQFYRAHRSIMLHFETDYNIKNYGIPKQFGRQQYIACRDKHIFNRLGKSKLSKNDAFPFWISQFKNEDLSWPGDIIINDRIKSYVAWKGIVKNLFRSFKVRIKQICLTTKRSPESLLELKPGETYPKIIQLAISNKIDVEIAIVLARCFDKVPLIQSRDSIYFPQWYKRFKEYSYFIDCDLTPYKEFLLELEETVYT